jgi:hypothetical protein
MENTQKATIAEFLTNQEAVKALLEEFTAIYFEADALWISGHAGRYAWSHGSTMGMKGEAYTVGPGYDPMVTSMHQGSVAMAFNANAGLHVVAVRAVNGAMVYEVAKTSLLGPGQVVDLTWNKEKKTFEGYKAQT